MNVEAGGQSFRLERAKLRKWLELDSIKSDYLSQAVEKRDAEAVARAIALYLSTALGEKVEFWLSLPWKPVFEAFVHVEDINLPKRPVPLIQFQGEATDQVSWHYDGRTWYLWADIFAKNYGWKLEYIASMEVDDALALMQEVLTREQFHKEFLWMLSEIAYPYNQSTKKSEFQPLPRPEWMLPTITTHKIPKIRLPKAAVPVGNIQDIGGMEEKLH